MCLAGTALETIAHFSPGLDLTYFGSVSINHPPASLERHILSETAIDCRTLHVYPEGREHNNVAPYVSLKIKLAVVTSLRSPAAPHIGLRPSYPHTHSESCFMPHESYLLDVLLTGSHASGQAPHSFDLVLIRQRHASDRSPADLNGATFSPHALKPSVSPLCGPKPDTTSFPRSGRRHTGGDVVPEVRII